MNIIIDFNNFVMRALYTCQFMYPDVTIKNFESKKELETLVRKVTADICKVIRMFTPQRVIISCDSKDPWRKSLYKEIDGMEYKGTRKKDEDKNWENIYDVSAKLKDILRNNGFIVSEFEHTEADDIATMWVEYLLDKKEDVVLVSSDMDWVQLIGKYGNNVCICYNPMSNNKGKKRLFIDENIKVWLNEKDKIDIFFNGLNKTKEIINNLYIQEPKLSIEVVDQNMILLDKIMTGDTSDNVPSFWFYYRNGRKNNVSPLKAKHVYEALDIHNVNDLIRANDNMMLKDVLEKEMKQDIEIDFKERLDRQRKLVELKSYLFPDKIRNNFNAVVNESYNKLIQNSTSIKMNDILGGTEYEEKQNERDYRLNGIFDDIESLGKYSFSSKMLFN